MVKKAVKMIISGTVQGVFFRQFIKETADNLKIKGFARNLENGDVEVIAEGNQNELEQFIQTCKQGPKFAKIKSVNVQEKNFSGDFPDFKVLRI